MRHPPIGEPIIALWSPKLVPTRCWCRLRIPRHPPGVRGKRNLTIRHPCRSVREGARAFLSPRGGTHRRGGTSPQSHALLSRPLSVLLTEQQTITTAAITANEWLAGRHDAHLPSRLRLASPLLGSWRSRRWLCSAAPPPVLLAPRRHAGARACVFPLVATYAPSASCGLPPIDGAGVELFTGYGSMSYCWRHFGFRIAALAENAASMQRTIHRGFPASVVIQDANAVNAAALRPASGSDSDADEDEPSSKTQ